MPWYDIYDEGVSALSGGASLAKVKSVSDLDLEHFGHADESTEPTTVDEITSYALTDPKGVYDGNW